METVQRKKPLKNAFSLLKFIFWGNSLTLWIYALSITYTGGYLVLKYVFQPDPQDITITIIEASACGLITFVALGLLATAVAGIITVIKKEWKEWKRNGK